MMPMQLQNTVRAIQDGKLDAAAKFCRDALKTSPRDFQAMYLLGFVHMRMENFEEAARIIGDAVRIDPSVPDAHYNLGCALQKLHRENEAIAAFDRALMINPNYLEAAFNRGTSLLGARRAEESLMAFEDLAAKVPNDPEVWHNHGEALAALGRNLEAITSYNHAIQLNPRSARSFARRGAAFDNLRDFENAAKDHERALALDPNFDFERGAMLYARLNCCDWDDLARQIAAVEKELDAGRHTVSPLTYILISSSPARQLRCSKIWCEKAVPVRPEPLWTGQIYDHDRIRIAYVSGDFRNHAVARLIAGVIENHDRSRFEISGVSLGPDDESRMRLRLKDAFDRFADVDSLSDRDAAAWMTDNEIDIAVDLTLYTGASRPGIFAQRAAPIQVNYLGFAATTGAGYYDYILADEIVIPKADRAYYSEKIVSLPDTFQPNDSQRKAADKKPSRRDEGLPDNAFVFCSFNNACKILPATFDIWMRLLREIPGSVFWLPQYNTAEVANLRREANARGISGDRIVFAALTPTPEEYLARLDLADLFLDTLPYNAHTTASDALWMGLPVLTQIGTTYAGRVAASLLNAVGLPELVTHSAEEYEQAALRLAREPETLDSIRKKLAANRAGAPLFDTVRHCRNIEAAFTAMHARHLAGEPPDHFAVTPI